MSLIFPTLSVGSRRVVVVERACCGLMERFCAVVSSESGRRWREVEGGEWRGSYCPTPIYILVLL